MILLIRFLRHHFVKQEKVRENTQNPSLVAPILHFAGKPHHLLFPFEDEGPFQDFGIE
jgi:hypothetical protein